MFDFYGIYHTWILWERYISYKVLEIYRSKEKITYPSLEKEKDIDSKVPAGGYVCRREGIWISYFLGFRFLLVIFKTHIFFVANDVNHTIGSVILIFFRPSWANLRCFIPL